MRLQIQFDCHGQRPQKLQLEDDLYNLVKLRPPFKVGMGMVREDSSGRGASVEGRAFLFRFLQEINVFGRYLVFRFGHGHEFLKYSYLGWCRVLDFQLVLS